MSGSNRFAIILLSFAAGIGCSPLLYTRYRSWAAIAALATLVCGLIIAAFQKEKPPNGVENAAAGRDQAVETLQQSEERYRLLFENNPQPMWVHDVETLRFLAVNRAMIRQYGYSRDELLAMTLKDIRPPEDIPALLAKLERLDPGLEDAVLSRHLTKDGTIIQVEIRSHGLDFSGRMARIAMATDVTERLRDAEALRISEQRLAEAQRIANIGSWEYDVQTQEISWSGETSRIFGFTRGAVAPSYTAYLQRIHPDDVANLQAATVDAVEEGIPYEFDQRLLMPDGEIRHIHTIGQPIYGANGDVTKLVGVVMDITARKKAEEALQEQEARLRLLMEQMPAILWTTDRELRFTSSTGAGLAALGQHPNSNNGAAIAQLFGCDERGRAPIAAHRQALQGAPSSCECELGERTYQVHVEPLHSRDGAIAGVIGVALDITASRQAEAALRASEERFRTLIENGSDIISVIDADGAIRYQSPSIKRVLGYTPEEMVGVNSFDLIHPEDIDAVRASLQRRLATPEAGLPAQFRFRHKDGTYRYLEATGNDLLDHPGIAGIVINSRDVTERHRAQEHIRSQFARLTALRAIDSLINASFDLRVTLSNFLDQVTGLLRVDAAAVLLYNPRSDELEYSALKGFLSDPPQMRIGVGQGVAGEAAQARRTILCSDLAENAHTLEHARLFRQEGFVTCLAVPLMAKRQVNGVLQIFHRAPLDTNGEWLDFLETLAGQAAIAIDNATLFEGVQHSNLELTHAYDATIEGWSRALDLRDKETEGHTRRVTEMTLCLAMAAGICASDQIHIRRGALLHDIGKMGIPDNILLKAGPLTAGEWEIMRRHPQYAYEMLSPVTFLRPALDIPYCHHEKWDGTGYPRGLKAEEIPLAARLFAVVDVWDALRSDRPYRPGWPADKVSEHILSLADTHFDPQAVDLFMQVMNQTDASPVRSFIAHAG